MDVSKETRAVLMGHATRDITSHYSGAGLVELLSAVDKLVQAKEQEVTIIKPFAARRRRGTSSGSREIHSASGSVRAS